MISADTRRAVDTVLRSTLAHWDYTGFDIEDRSDHDGDPALFIIANFAQVDRWPSSKATIAAMAALRERLLADGDDRLPYLNYRYPEEPQADDEAA